MQLLGRPGLWVSHAWGPGWSPRTCPGGSECALWLLPRTERTGCRLHVAARTPAAVKCRVRGFGPRWARRFRQCPVLSGSILGSCLLLCRLSKLGAEGKSRREVWRVGPANCSEKSEKRTELRAGCALGECRGFKGSPGGCLLAGRCLGVYRQSWGGGGRFQNGKTRSEVCGASGMDPQCPHPPLRAQEAPHSVRDSPAVSGEAGAEQVGPEDGSSEAPLGPLPLQELLTPISPFL